MSGKSVPADYFDRLYAGDPDPWGFKDRAYEHEKYAETVAILEGRRFARGVEVGCSIGELTARLAPEVGDLLGVDVAEAALETARARNADMPNVRFVRMALPGERPQGVFDLIVLSEVLYYFGEEDLAKVADWTCEALAPDGVAVLAHWLGETPDYPLTGDEAVERFLTRTAGALTIDRRSRRALYRLERLVRGAPSASGAAPPG